MLETLPITEQELVQAARRGDDDAFRVLIEPHCEKLHQHCRRILGSAHDADDALQDALVRAWRGLPGFGGDRPLGPWLHRIATNASLDALKKRRHTVPIDGAVEPEAAEAVAAADPPASPAARYEQREAVELAVVTALRHLSARQRAALILSDALDFSARDAARAMQTSTASVTSALQRARKLVGERVPDQSKAPALHSIEDRELKADVERLTSAMDRADVATIVRALVAA